MGPGAIRLGRDGLRRRPDHGSQVPVPASRRIAAIPTATALPAGAKDRPRGRLRSLMRRAAGRARRPRAGAPGPPAPARRSRHGSPRPTACLRPAPGPVGSPGRAGPAPACAGSSSGAACRGDPLARQCQASAGPPPTGRSRRLHDASHPRPGACRRRPRRPRRAAGSRAAAPRPGPQDGARWPAPRTAVPCRFTPESGPVALDDHDGRRDAARARRTHLSRLRPRYPGLRRYPVGPRPRGPRSPARDRLPGRLPGRVPEAGGAGASQHRAPRQRPGKVKPRPARVSRPACACLRWVRAVPVALRAPRPFRRTPTPTPAASMRQSRMEAAGVGVGTDVARARRRSRRALPRKGRRSRPEPRTVQMRAAVCIQLM